MSNPSLAKIMVCSFFTDDEYYAAHARRLEENLREIGVPHEISVMERAPGEDWADICRKKVGFLAKICASHPDKKVFWIDVDCELLDLPDYIVNSTADVIGFQRSFGSPLQIGYQNRTRFWEPCFWGVNNSPQGRKMIEDAFLFEQNSSIKATDDYFFEEGWRANASNLTFQLIPSNAVASRGDEIENSRSVFFKFGSSGKVAEFKNQVEQHQLSGSSWKRRMRLKALTAAKKIQNLLPEATRQWARKLSDKLGVTGALTGDKHHGEMHPTIKQMLNLAKHGNSKEFSDKFDAFRGEKMASATENRAITSALSFLHYATIPSESTIKLSWWSYPHPGNFGDWLSPYLIQGYSRNRISFQALAEAEQSTHIMAVGSIGRFIKKKSIVFGTGISSDQYPLEPRARYISVRGPRTAELLKRSGGPRIDSFGDPGVLVSRLFPILRGETNGKIALVRHHSHRALPVKLPENMEEISVLRSHPSKMEEFFLALNKYDSVVTSAMHVYIACQSYGIPVALISFKGFEGAVHGDGIKYVDYAEGAGVSVLSPRAVPLNLKSFSCEDYVTIQKISSEKMDEVELSLMRAINTYLETTGQRKAPAKSHDLATTWKNTD